MAYRKFVNSANARRLATYYEAETGQKFPQGISNAYICRANNDAPSRGGGRWAWSLEAIHNETHQRVLAMGSTSNVAECLKLGYGWEHIK